MDQAEVLFKLCLLVLWIGGVIYFANKAGPAMASLNWPVSIGTVSSSQVDVSYLGKGYVYMPCVEYQYEVDGTTYNSNNVTYLGINDRSKRCAEKCVNKYIVGGEAEVFYNPKSPQLSVLVPGIHWLQYVGMVLMSVVVFGMAYIL